MLHFLLLTAVPYPAGDSVNFSARSAMVEGVSTEEMAEALLDGELCKEEARTAATPENLTFTWKLQGAGGLILVRSLALQPHQLLLAPHEARENGQA